MNRNDKVIFTGENSTPYQEGIAKKALVVDGVYEIEKVIEGGWFSWLVLKGVSGQFAIEMFKKLDTKISLN